MIFDLGIWLGLISLPTLTVLVVILMVGRHFDGAGQEEVLAAVRHPVCSEPSTIVPLCNILPGAAARFPDRSGDRAVGAHCAGHGHDPVHRRVDPAGRLSAVVAPDWHNRMYVRGRYRLV